MCNFLSIASDPIKDRILFFDEKIRMELEKNNPKEYDYDSHSSVINYFGYSAKEEDRLNKYEYNPFTGVFKTDQINNEIDDNNKIRKFCKEYNFDKIIESGLYDLNLYNLTSLPENIKFPDTIKGSLFLNSLTSLPENIKFPDTIKGSLNLNSLTSLPENIKFPDTIEGFLNLYNLTSLPENIKFPKKLKGSLNLNSLTSLPENIKFPETIKKVLYLSNLTSLPENIKLNKNIKYILKEEI